MSLQSETLESAIRWKIENFSLQKGILESPHFYSFGAIWRVKILLKDLCLSGDEIVIKISFSQLSDWVEERNWSCAFLNSNGSLLNFIEKKCAVNSSKSCGACAWTLKYDDIFNESYLPNDILVVESCIWFDCPSLFVLQPTELEKMPLLPPTSCEQYRVVIRKNFVWNGYIDPGRTVNHAEPLLKDKALRIKIWRETEQRLRIILKMPTCIVLAKYQVYLYKTQENYLQFVEDQLKPDNSSFGFYLNFVSSDELNKFSNLNVFEFLFSCTYYNTSTENICANSSNLNTMANRKRVVSDEPQSRQPPLQDKSITITQDLGSMYEKCFLSDFSLRAQDRTFPVHKSILCARSSVFSAMFTADMNEKESGHVDIPDVDADTLQRMLHFVYWEHMDKNLQWESTCSLYSAADKYALEPLKQRCSSHLSANLSATNVLDVLVLSDTYQDQVLKAAALDYIYRNDKNIIDTERWNRFKEENGPLSYKISRQLYLNIMA